MKNVTGFDLSKLVCGSYGTLAMLTEVTLKVLPKPETEQSLLILGLDEATSLALLRRAAGTFMSNAQARCSASISCIQVNDS